MLWEDALAIGTRTIATTVILANAFNIDHPNYVLKNVCVLIDKIKNHNTNVWYALYSTHPGVRYAQFYSLSIH